MAKPMLSDLTPAELAALLSYNPATGELRSKPRPKEWFSTQNRARHPVPDPQEWATKKWNARYANKPTFTAKEVRGGYHGNLLGRKYKAHRVIWVLMTGSWPTGEIDHKDGDPCNNKWENLRVVDRSQQMRNRISGKRNKVLPRGVYIHKNGRAYYAQIMVNRQTINLGTFSTPEEAHQAYLTAAEEHHGEYAHHLSRRAG